jgi:hypothetical protein
MWAIKAYLILLPGEGQLMVVMTNSDNGSILAEALIRKAAPFMPGPRSERWLIEIKPAPSGFCHNARLK